MPRCRFFLCFCCVLLAALCCAQGQSSAQQPAPAVDTAGFGQRIALGPKWRFQSGDNPAWAAPGFDDSHWQTLSTEADFPGTGGQRFYWYRAHLRLRPGAPPAMIALKYVFGFYDVYVNGVRIGGSDGTASGSYRLQSHLRGFAIPAGIAGSDGNLVLALRFHYNLDASLGQVGPIPAGSSVYLLSQESYERELSYDQVHMYGKILLKSCLSLLIALVALGLFAAMRRRPEYLAAFVFLLLSTAEPVGETQISLHDYSLSPELIEFAIFAALYVSLVEFVRITLGYRRTAWLLAFEIVLGLCVWLAVPLALQGMLTATFAAYLYWVLIAAADTIMLAMTVRSIRAGNPDARLLLLPVLLECVEHYWTLAANALNQLTHASYGTPTFHLAGYAVSLDDVADYTFLICILLFLVLRTVGIARRQAQAAAELAAAREVQQRLVPVELPAIPGCALEAAYIPAAEVGGDFYHVERLPGGEALFVVGDVSGKGLKAAMTGAMAMGAIRTLASENLSPGELLARLNRPIALSGQGGFITCLCLRIAPGGSAAIANAGHLAPYRNGEEIAIENGLPLGVTQDAAYPETTFELRPGDRLTLLSDGVVEATNASRELFGFERAAAASTGTANEIASTAQHFGQQDDITVLTIAYAS